MQAEPYVYYYVHVCMRDKKKWKGTYVRGREMDDAYYHLPVTTYAYFMGHDHAVRLDIVQK